MFTGIVETVGSLKALERRGEDATLVINSAGLDLSDVILGDSIAVNGVCLTVTGLQADGFNADVSSESLGHTCLGELAVGSAVNLEKALTPKSRLGGHIVTGHVDGVGEIIERVPSGRAEKFTVQAPAELARYIARKGSITLDGVSLTVNDVDNSRFELMIIPHTQQQTIIPEYTPGRRVHLEVDIIARYLERLLTAPEQEQPAGLTLETLAKHGFSR